MNKALLVGINDYPDPANVLHGCINDIDDMAAFLSTTKAFGGAKVHQLMDAAATHDAIVTALQAMVSSAGAGDHLLFHYSGHGAQMPQTDATGATTGVIDTMCPYDFDWTAAHAITSADFQQLFSVLPAGARLTWISDSCYSGGYAKMFAHFFGGAQVRTIKTIPQPPKIHQQILNMQKTAPVHHLMRDMAQMLAGTILLSACTSTQEAADAAFGERPNGALTYYLLQELKSVNGLTEASSQAVLNVNAAIAGYQQNPELHGDRSLFLKPVLSSA